MILGSTDLAPAHRYCTFHLPIRKLQSLCLAQGTNLVDHFGVTIVKSEQKR